MNSIGRVQINRKELEELKDLLNVFEPDENNKKVTKLQVNNGKLEIKYEDGE